MIDDDPEIDELYEESLRVGLTEALELATERLKQSYADQIHSFQRAVIRAATARERIVQHEKRLEEFFENLRPFVSDFEPEPWWALCIVHTSTPKEEIDELCERFGHAELSRSSLANTNGSHLLDYCVAEIALRSGMLRTHGIPFANAALSFLKRGNFVNRYWLKAQLGPLIGDEPLRQDLRAVLWAYNRLLGTIYSRRGLPKAVQFVERSIDPKGLMHTFEQQIEMGDAKTLLQEFLQAEGRTLARYELSRVDGTSDHEPTFVARAHVPLIEPVEARARSKLEATMKAAEQAIIALSADTKLGPRLNRRVKELTKRRRPPLADALTPVTQAVESYSDDIQRRVGVRPATRVVATALTCVEFAIWRGQRRQTNVDLCYLGSKLIEAVLDQALLIDTSRRLHPLFLERLLDETKTLLAQREMFGRTPSQGLAKNLDTIQAVIYATYAKDGPTTISWLNRQLKALAAEVGDSDGRPKQLWKIAPRDFDTSFSYVQAIQEFTQAIDKSLPTYKDHADFSRPHDPSHTAVAVWRGYTGRGTGSRLSWARNVAAHQLLLELIKAQFDG